MKKIIITIGPALLKDIENLPKDPDRYIFRINGAHNSDEETIVRYIKVLKKHINYPKILIDLPGNKIRTTNLGDGINIKEGEIFTLSSNQTNYPKYLTLLKKNDIIWANDSQFKFIVKEVKNDVVVLLSESNGKLINNKGMHVLGINDNLPFLFEKDFQLIKIANKLKLDYVGLSFVRNADDVLFAQSIIGSDSTIIAKVETKAAVKNLNAILKVIDHILIDRGDLSTEIGIEKIPSYQKYIVEKALFFNKRVFLATQILKHMEESPIPTIAEMVDLYNNFKMGIYGIQLSEETAIGKYPINCIHFINKVLSEVHDESQYK